MMKTSGGTPLARRAPDVPETLRTVPSCCSCRATLTCARSRARVLGREGYVVTTAAHAGHALLAGLSCDRIDILISEMELDDMPGPALAERAAPPSRRTRALFMADTARPQADGLVVRPFTRDDLLAALELAAAALLRRGILKNESSTGTLNSTLSSVTVATGLPFCELPRCERDEPAVDVAVIRNLGDVRDRRSVGRRRRDADLPLQPGLRVEVEVLRPACPSSSPSRDRRACRPRFLSRPARSSAPSPCSPRRRCRTPRPASRTQPAVRAAPAAASCRQTSTTMCRRTHSRSLTADRRFASHQVGPLRHGRHGAFDRLAAMSRATTVPIIRTVVVAGFFRARPSTSGSTR